MMLSVSSAPSDRRRSVQRVRGRCSEDRGWNDTQLGTNGLFLWIETQVVSSDGTRRTNKIRWN